MSTDLKQRAIMAAQQAAAEDKERWRQQDEVRVKAAYAQLRSVFPELERHGNKLHLAGFVWEPYEAAWSLSDGSPSYCLRCGGSMVYDLRSLGRHLMDLEREQTPIRSWWDRFWS